MNHLKLEDRFAELLAFRRIFDAVADQSLGNTDAKGADVQAALIQYFHGSSEANIFLAAYQIGGADPNIVEHYITNIGALLAHFAIGLTHANARTFDVNQKCGHAAGARFIGIGAGENSEQLGLWCISDIALRAIEQVVITIFFRRQAHRCRVRTSLWLS